LITPPSVYDQTRSPHRRGH